MKDISHLYGEKSGSLFEGYYDLELERIADIGNEKHFELMDVQERRAIRYYFQHRREEIAFSASWAVKIESAIAKIYAYEQEQAVKRLVIFDKKTERYWAGLNITTEAWCKTKAKALLFLETERSWLKQICDRTNKKTGHSRRFVVVQIDAAKRLSKCKF